MWKRQKLGDRYVLENMREHGYNIGGEQSGHVIFLDDNTTGDGLLSALHLLEVMVKRKNFIRACICYGSITAGTCKCKSAKP